MHIRRSMKKRRRDDQRYSVIQPALDECYVCGRRGSLNKHEVFEGTANTQKSIEWGMVVALCSFHHNSSNHGVHYNKELNRRIKQEAQRVFQKTYPDEDFIKIFGKNYL